MHGRCHWSVPKYSTRGSPVWTKEVLDNRMEKYISSYTLCDIAEVVCKNNIFKFGKKLLNQKEGLQSEQNLHLLTGFCLWQNWKSKFFKKENLNRLYG